MQSGICESSALSGKRLGLSAGETVTSIYGSKQASTAT